MHLLGRAFLYPEVGGHGGGSGGVRSSGGNAKKRIMEILRRIF
jgi:hypothetical protein